MQIKNQFPSIIDVNDNNFDVDTVLNIDRLMELYPYELDDDARRWLHNVIACHLRLMTLACKLLIFLSFFIYH